MPVFAKMALKISLLLLAGSLSKEESPQSSNKDSVYYSVYYKDDSWPDYQDRGFTSYAINGLTIDHDTQTWNPKTRNSVLKSVPNSIWQTNKNYTLPIDAYWRSEDWVRFNPGHSYHLATDSQVENLIKAHVADDHRYLYDFYYKEKAA